MKVFLIILISFVSFSAAFPQNSDSLTVKDTVNSDSGEITTPEIKVDAQKDFMRVEDDKTIFDISKMKEDPGPNALELMRKIPMLTVENETILLRGSSPKILINGRESQMYGDLKSISSDLIESIEVMTVAPSKYEAEGVSGVVNIVLKKLEEAKYNVFLSSGATTNSSYNSFIDANYKRDAFSFFLNSSGNWNNIKSNNFLSTKNLSTNEITLSSTDTSKSNFQYYRINPGIIYDIASNLYIGVEGVLGMSLSNYNSTSLRQYSYGSVQNILNNGDFDNNNYSLLTYLNKKELAGEKDELNLEFNLNNSTNKSNSSQQQLIDGSLDPFFNNNSTIKNNNYTAKIDYSNKFAENFNFETGIRENYRDEINNNESIDSSGSTVSNYEFIQKIFSYYSTLSYRWNTFRIKPGIRVEYADMKGIVNTSSEFTNYKLDVFPSLTLTKFFPDNSQLQLVYGRKIDRPRFNSLNPYPFNRDIYQTTYGNPDLQPSYTDIIEFKASKPIEKNYANLNVFFRHGTDLIQTIRTIDSIYTTTTFINNGYMNEYGADGGINLNFADFYYTSIYGGINKKIFSDDSLNALSNRVYYYFNISGGYSNPLLFSINFSVYHSGPRYSPYNISDSFTSIYIGASKSFFDEKLYISMNISDPFKKSSFENRYIHDGYEQFSSYMGGYSQTISLNISYRFGNYDENRKKGKDIKEESYND